jgi:hypothetical protein
MASVRDGLSYRLARHYQRLFRKSSDSPKISILSGEFWVGQLPVPWQVCSDERHHAPWPIEGAIGVP